jgi:hypothetical protein
MPKKVVVKIKKQGQRQSQKQNVKQTVIVRLDGEKKKKRKYRRRPRREPSDGVSSMERALPPPVIYQASAVPYPVFREAPKVRTINEEPGRRQGFLEDIGQVGTEGAVQILEPPEPEYVNLVEKPKPIPSEFFSKKIQEFRSMKEPMINWEQPPPISVPRTRRNKKEMEEARTMEREDIASINLGLAQFNPLLQSKGIHEGMPKTEPSREAEKSYPDINQQFTPLFEPQAIVPKKINSQGRPIESLTTTESLMEEQNIPESVLKGKRVNVGSWNYWINKFEELTGQRITEYRAKQQYGTKENFANFIKSNLKE